MTFESLFQPRFRRSGKKQKKRGKWKTMELSRKEKRQEPTEEEQRQERQTQENPTPHWQHKVEPMRSGGSRNQETASNNDNSEKGKSKRGTNNANKTQICQRRCVPSKLLISSLVTRPAPLVIRQASCCQRFPYFIEDRIFTKR